MPGTSPLLEDIDESVDHYDRRLVHGCLASRDDQNLLSPGTPGTPLRINGLSFATPEALYQALKFPNQPRLQAMIAAEPDAAGALARAQLAERLKPRWKRAGWSGLRVAAMTYALTAALLARPGSRAELLATDPQLPIVQIDVRNAYWSAQPDPGREWLTGCNVAGKILTEIRDDLLARGKNRWQTGARINAELPRERLLVNQRTAPPLSPRSKGPPQDETP